MDSFHGLVRCNRGLVRLKYEYEFLNSKCLCFDHYISHQSRTDSLLFNWSAVGRSEGSGNVRNWTEIRKSYSYSQRRGSSRGMSSRAKCVLASLPKKNLTKIAQNQPSPPQKSWGLGTKKGPGTKWMRGHL